MIFLLSVFYGPPARSFQIVKGYFLWLSPNLAPAARDTRVSAESETIFLGDLAYDRYFERHGQPPPLPFLVSLQKDSRRIAHIEGKGIVFHRNNSGIPLKSDRIPPGADPASPYLLGIPDSDRVLVVYPFYLHGCKENDHVVEAYTAHGSLLHTFDSLPTHRLKDFPHILISQDKSGCCDSLRWSIRFYNLDTGIRLDLRCPEGACGDVLFTELGTEGPFIVGLEIIGFEYGLGASLQTNLYVMSRDGSVRASGKILYARQDASIQKPHIQALSPYSISKLVSASPDPNAGAWHLAFRDDDRTRMLKMAGMSEGVAPAVVFLIPKDSKREAKIEWGARKIDALPTLVISEPGDFTVFQPDRKQGSRMSIRPDTVNRVILPSQNGTIKTTR